MEEIGCLPAASWHDDLPHRLRSTLGMLAGRYRSGNRVPLVLVRAHWHAFEPKVRQSFTTPGRPASAASPAVPASPRGGWEDLDDLHTADLKCAVQLKPVFDPLVVGIASNSRFVGRPADAADFVVDAVLAGTSLLALRRAASWAVDRDDGRPLRLDELDNLLGRQSFPERDDPVIVNQRDIETLPFPAHIDAEPANHEQSMPDGCDCCPHASPSAVAGSLTNSRLH